MVTPILSLALECEAHLLSGVEHHPEIGCVLGNWQRKRSAQIFSDASTPSISESRSSSGDVDDGDKSTKVLDDVDSSES